MKKVSVVFTLSILFLGMIMRAPFTTIPTVLPEIAQTFHMQLGALGILTTIPLLIFAGLSSFAGKIMQRFGLERVLLAAILFIFIGSILRIAGYGPMLVGTVLIGLGITFINVLLPATLIKYVPAQIGQYTGLYSTTMTVSTALFQMIAVPIVAIASWQVLIVILSIVVGLAGIIWLLNMREVAAAAHAIQTPQVTPEFAKVNPWSNKYAWAILVAAGVQSALFYTTIAWVPTMAQDAGLSGSEAGIIIGWMSLIGLPISVILPSYYARVDYKKRRLAVVVAVLAWLVGVLMMFNQSSSFIWWFIIMTLAGIGATAVFMYIVIAYAIRTRNHIESAVLSGMAQSGGYLIAAFTPTGAGLIYTTTHSWDLLIVGMVILLVIFGAVVWFSEREATIFE